jgi:hypothetical protein
MTTVSVASAGTFAECASFGSLSNIDTLRVRLAPWRFCLPGRHVNRPWHGHGYCSWPFFVSLSLEISTNDNSY